jgi:sulfonate transport system ATP-binding protein
MALDHGQLLTASAAHTSAAPAPVVEASGLRRAFGSHVVLDGLELTIAQGEFVALLGRSGSGKSTLLRAVAGLDDETTGRLRVVRRRSVVFQDARLVPWKRVLANVALGADDHQRERGKELLAEVGLAGRERSWPKTLSGGEAQRVALARALSREPRLLLLDEPFGALDALTRIKMHALLADLIGRHRPVVLLVTHDVEEALRLASRVLVLGDGVISFDAPVPGDDRARARLRHDLLVELGVDDVPL